MAYLPSPIEHDLFLSYSRKDADWVGALQEQLTERLLHRLSSEGDDVWQDKNKITTGQNWPDALDRAIRASAAFIAVVSRNYQNSRECEKELEIFLDEAGKKDALETGGYGRVLKVIKFPWLDNAHEGFYPSYQHVPFFESDPKTGQEREYRRASEAFRKAVDKLSFHVEELFKAMLRGTEKVFIARASSDVSGDRELIVRDVKASGFALSPPPMGAILKGLDDKTLLKFIREARVTVHPLGAAGDPVIRRQIDLALEAGKKTVFCLMRGHEAAQGEQKTLIEEIRANKWNLAAGSWALLESRSLATLKQDLIELLKPPKPTEGSARKDAARIYLLCDPSSSEDAGFARQVQGKIKDVEKFEVELPRAASDSSSPSAQHERLLRWCDGLLLYHDKAPPKWYSRNFADLLTAEDLTERRELKSKALLAAVGNVEIPGLTVIQRRNPFDLGQIEPFLAPLRQPSARPGASANVGG